MVTFVIFVMLLYQKLSLLFFLLITTTTTITSTVAQSENNNNNNRRSRRRQQSGRSPPPVPLSSSPVISTLPSSSGQTTYNNPFLALDTLTDNNSSTYQQTSAHNHVPSSSSGPPSQLMSSLVLQAGVGGIVSGGGFQENRENLNMQKYKSKPIWKTTSNSRTPGLLSSSLDPSRLSQLHEGTQIISSVLSTTNSDIGNSAANVANRFGDGMADRLDQLGYDAAEMEGEDVFTNRIGMRCDPNKQNSRFVCMKEITTTTSTLPPTIWQKRRKERKQLEDINRQILNESYHQHRQHNPFSDAPPPQQQQPIQQQLPQQQLPQLPPQQQ
eukprot:GHVS01093680.1.p1 GENE.GHVS01093680.1~~GHVS01093680.1.p1  ORF type:complete len:327 (+),score=103.82 GHVS01093680.1:163-1143(+)